MEFDKAFKWIKASYIRNVQLVIDPAENIILPEQKPETDINWINFRRLSILTPYFLVLTYFMFGLAIYVQEHDSLKLALALLAILTTFMQIALLYRRPAPGTSMPALQRAVTDFFALTLLLWGATMIGHDPNSMIPYFDFLIAVFSVGIVLLLPDLKLLGMYLITLVYVLTLTPLTKLYTENKLLLIVSMIVFISLAFVLSRVYYRQFLNSLRLSNRLYEQHAHLAELVDIKSRELLLTQDRMSREIIRVFAKVLDDYDSYTRGHSENVAQLSEKLAKRLNFSEDFQQQIFWAGMIHDVGKIRIPKHILNKTTQLTAEEFEKIRQHPVFGYEMIHESESLRPLASIVLSHHEHYDGNGQPHGLKGDQIPIAAQILSIADSWDAMRSRRVYREPLSVEHAKAELIRCSGKQFSPPLVNTFILMIEEEE